MTNLTDVGEVELAIGGMTCASCAARIEKKLNRMDGVEATVNYATEKAKVTYSGSIAVSDLIATVEATGYTAQEPTPVAADSTSESGTVEEPDPHRSLRQRLVTTVVLAVPVIAMAMVPAFQFEYWQWLSLTLTAPVVTYAGLALPQGRVDQRQAWRRDDGHTHLGRNVRGIPVVPVGIVLRHRGHPRNDTPLRADHRPE
ncbi:cation transport ATPase [Streptomyces ambofaciens]